MSEFRNINMVINYAREILKAQGGHYPQIENTIRQAEMDVQHYAWLLESRRRVEDTTSEMASAFFIGVGVGVLVMFVLFALV